MHPKFGDWHRLVSIEPKGEILELRWAGVESVTKAADKNRVLDLLRLALNKAGVGSDFLIWFQTLFRERDPAFPASDNAFELRVLGGSVCVCIFEGQQDSSEAVALGICSASFPAIRVDSLASEFLLLAQKYLVARGISLRNAGPAFFESGDPELQRLVEQTAQALQANQYASVATLWPQTVRVLDRRDMDVRRALAVQQEQSEVAWWILGEFSREAEVHLSKLPPGAACLSVGKELADLTTMPVAPSSAMALLERMLLNVGKERLSGISIQQAVNQCDPDRRRSWAQGLLEGGAADLIPLHLGVIRSLETDGESAWLSAFKKGTGIDAKKQIAPLDLAYQFYTERLFIRALRNGTQ